MYFPGRILCLLILILAQLVNSLVYIVPEETSMDQENNVDSMVEEKSNESTRKIIESTALNLIAANSSTFNITKVNCMTDKVYGPVEIVNETRLIELLILEPVLSNRTRNDKESKLLPGTCILILFYARWCIFSSEAAPHYNALPRSFPHIKAVAIDAMKYQRFNAQYGIVGVPTVMLVHNGKSVAKFNATVYTLESFSEFITQFSTLQPNRLAYVTDFDFNGPVASTPSNETDYYLVLSWIFITACALYFTSQSRWWQQFVELVQNTWRESNAQHEHVD